MNKIYRVQVIITDSNESISLEFEEHYTDINVANVAYTQLNHYYDDRDYSVLFDELTTTDSLVNVFAKVEELKRELT